MKIKEIQVFKLGDYLPNLVRKENWNGVWKELETEIEGQSRNQVWAEIGRKVWEQVREQVWFQIWMNRE